MKECYIRFRAIVNEDTIRDLLATIDQKYREDYNKIHLLISTPGGNVKDGLDTYNYLKSIPLKIYTYNVGSIDSIGVIVYCGGEKRFSVPHARFLLHPVGATIQNARFNEHDFREHLKSIELDQLNIARVIAYTTGQQNKVHDVLKKIHDRTTLDPKEAKGYKLVEEINSDIFPQSAELIAIENPPLRQNTPLPFPINIPMNTSNIYDKGMNDVIIPNHYTLIK